MQLFTKIQIQLFASVKVLKITAKIAIIKNIHLNYLLDIHYKLNTKKLVKAFS